jgi:hypothetical protein
MHEHGNRLVSLATATIAVLAALGTLSSHHRSIAALTAKNQAILLQARAADASNRLEAERIRIQIGEALYDAGIPGSPVARAAARKALDEERAALPTSKARVQEYERRSEADDMRSERVMRSYEVLEIATAFFEIAIVLVSLASLVNTKFFLSFGCALSGLGLILLIYGLVT